MEHMYSFKTPVEVLNALPQIAQKCSQDERQTKVVIDQSMLKQIKFVSQSQSQSKMIETQVQPDGTTIWVIFAPLLSSMNDVRITLLDITKSYIDIVSLCLDDKFRSNIDVLLRSLPTDDQEEQVTQHFIDRMVHSSFIEDLPFRNNGWSQLSKAFRSRLSTFGDDYFDRYFTRVFNEWKFNQPISSETSLVLMHYIMTIQDKTQSIIYQQDNEQSIFE
ncbi:hypothetical protein SAMD00019534_071450 [Acytostelium subglobosum LB1]|uniref:hypothetical protein n=1 Tax=Acytostelium subglobosum LB1 TaxID=1410327 RepID=UPI000644E1E3|nr:hypothetical protein SAMD00019534_071450 [Acytostelium subglobosum LB1]GAM23970.1 hypothetical protein SAMD00019534_071450 [Acytostelium subglobosum LB1]|eukprot:XP_012753006.1 hypothetical protein SAMD00019534_071450 [Acytostelium subglobosum LB1]